MTHVAPKHSYRLLAVDLDGTLVGHGLGIPPGTVEAMEEFKANGGYITIATGRSIRTTIPFAEEIAINAPLICYQGAVVHDYRNDMTLFHQPVPAALAAEAIIRLRGAGIYVHAYVDDDLYVPYKGARPVLPDVFADPLCRMHVVDDLAGISVLTPAADKTACSSPMKVMVGPRIAGFQAHFAERLNIARSHALLWRTNRAR